jgi:hypothetical protein
MVDGAVAPACPTKSSEFLVARIEFFPAIKNRTEEEAH